MRSEKEYWWISVGGGECEPAIIKHEERVAYTLGCPDALPFDRFQMVAKMAHIPQRPRTAEEQADFEKWLEDESKAGRRHGYKRF